MKNRCRRTGNAGYVLTAFAMFIAIGCSQEHAPTVNTHTAATSQPARNPPADLVDLTPGPVVTFETSCARCHGPHGSFFGDTFADLNDEKLHEMVTEMMRGPAQLQPRDRDIEAMVAYHQAMREHLPFASINNASAWAAGQDKSIMGECTPDTKVHLRKGATAIPASMDGLTWKISQPPASPFIVVAQAGDSEVQFEFPHAQWSRATVSGP